jgi:predicted PurR-regulated permease PerM
VYFILINWTSISIYLSKFIPLENKEKVMREIADSTHSLIYGTFMIGLIEFTIAALGFYLCGISPYFLMAALVFVFAFIPGGPGFVWVPLLVYQLFKGSYYSALGILIIGLIISIYADTILRNRILGNKTKINPFVMLLGVIGGVSIFGLFGFIIGPLILEYTLRILKQTTSKK